MKSPDLTSLQWFCLAVGAGSLSKAAERAGVSPPTMSRSLARLEQSAGLKLIHRSAREFRLTAEGEQYFNALSPVFQHLSDQLEVLSAHASELTGDIRLSCPESLVTSLVHAWVCEFLAQHPKVSVNISFGLTEDHFVRDRLDLAIVVRPPTRKDIVQTRIITSDMWLAAAPSYVASQGHPERAEDLHQFDLLCADSNEKWEFVRQVENLVLHPEPRYCLSSMQCLVDAAVEGLGICNAPRVLVEKSVLSGRLVRLLEHENVHQTHIYLVFSDRKLIPERVRVLARFLQQKSRGLRPVRDKV